MAQDTPIPKAIAATALAVRRSGLERSSPFSYQCHACQRCCQDKLIRVNPYEVLQLARACAIDTTTFLQRYVDRETSFLRQTPQGNCVFLDPQRACTVHAHRPLVCRLYPLGRRVSGEGAETFAVLEPHPDSAGEYGTHQRVQDYLDGQGADPYLKATDALLELFHAAYARPSPQPGSPTGEMADSALDWLDVDLVLEWSGAQPDVMQAEPEHKFRHYLDVLREQIHVNTGGPDEATVN